MSDSPRRTESVFDERVFEHLLRIEKGLESVAKDQEAIKDYVREQCEALAEKIEKQNVILTGNGDPSKGIVVRLAMAESKIVQGEKDMADFRDGRKWMFRSLVATVIASVASVLVALAKTKTVP